MDLEKTGPLSPEEAKARLRQAVGELGLHAWVKRRPYEALAVSFATGLVLATSKSMRGLLLKTLMRII
jgi:hypothetical protein